MGRKVYFAFHYEDVATFRANVVRKCWVINDRVGFWDHSMWESTKAKGPAAIKALIGRAIRDTSVTTVLIGSQTYARRWVRYEIAKSFIRGNGLLGIHINGIPDKDRKIYPSGLNPFDFMYFQVDEAKRLVRIFEWKSRPVLGPPGSRKYGWEAYKDFPVIPLKAFNYDLGGIKKGRLSLLFPVYQWDTQKSPNEIDSWVELAALKAGR